jgi:hypothetical protein
MEALSQLLNRKTTTLCTRQGNDGLRRILKNDKISAYKRGLLKPGAEGIVQPPFLLRRRLLLLLGPCTDLSDCKGHAMSSFSTMIAVALCVGALTAFGWWSLEQGKGQRLFNRFSPRYDRFMERWGFYHVEAIQQVLKPQTAGQALLDVGGGTGYLVSRVAERYARVVVADLSPGMLSVARGRKLETVEASALALPFKTAEFDAVLCTDALHHIKQIERAVSEMCRVLKPGEGVLLLLV